MNTRRISKFLSLILRHKPETIGITLDPEGWATTQEIIDGMNAKGMSVTLEMLQEVVATNDKQRFKLSDDASRIRANQGHSIPVDLGMEAIEPPAVLFHGTATKNQAAILREGIQKRKREYVHLSADVETATKVGQRHGKPVILTIDTAKMHETGVLFYRSENGVWLTDFVAAEYISFA